MGVHRMVRIPWQQGLSTSVGGPRRSPMGLVCRQLAVPDRVQHSRVEVVTKRRRRRVVHLGTTSRVASRPGGARAAFPLLLNEHPRSRATRSPRWKLAVWSRGLHSRGGCQREGRRSDEREGMPWRGGRKTRRSAPPQLATCSRETTLSRVMLTECQERYWQPRNGGRKWRR
jgi:hypothetical protein